MPIPRGDSLREAMDRMIESEIAARKAQARIQAEMERAVLYGTSMDPSFFFTNTQSASAPPPQQPKEKPMPDDQLPKEALLLKFLNMTTSPADGEALTAMRKANSLLRDAGWTWEMLLQAKIKIIANPFANLKTPERVDKEPLRPKTPGPAPQRTYASPPVNSSRRNSYSGGCWCCGTHVDDNQGYIFTPNLYNGAAPSSYKVICPLCNHSTRRIADTPAPYAGPPQPTCRTPVSSNNPAYHEGDCYCCGAFLPLGSAFLFSPKSFNHYATTNAALICDLCNQNSYLAIPSTPHAPRSRPQPQYSTQPRKKRTQTRRYMPGIDEL